MAKNPSTKMVFFGAWINALSTAKYGRQWPYSTAVLYGLRKKAKFSLTVKFGRIGLRNTAVPYFWSTTSMIIADKSTEKRSRRDGKSW